MAKTIKGLKFEITTVVPRMKQAFGAVFTPKGRVETLWDSTGQNLEDPEWDIEAEVLEREIFEGSDT